MSIFINYQIAKEFNHVDGKTKALFGIKELLQYSYQYYVVVLGLVALIFSLLAKQTETKNHRKIAIIFSLISIAIVFARIWRLFV